MSLAASARAFPALLKIGFAEAVAYRAELLIWILTSTMPLIMLALWSTVASEGPIGRYGQDELTIYFLGTFIVRQLAAAWTCWEINYEVRLGKLSTRLLRPVHPLVAYAAEGIAALPLRLTIAVPVALFAAWQVGWERFPQDATRWSLWLVSIVGAWLIVYFTNIAIGSLSFFMESSIKLMDVYFAAYFVLSGYMVPIDLFPPALRTAVDWLPFRYQLGLPTELLCGMHDVPTALGLIGQQWLYVIVLGTLGTFAWQRGVRHFEAFGG